MRKPDPVGRASRAPQDAEARRRRAQVFGDVLPDTTGDERDAATGEGGDASNDAWLRDNVPPHHG